VAFTSGSLIGGRYRLLDVLGAGGTGEVFRAHDVREDASRALKLLRAEVAADAESRARFLEAAALASALTGPHLARVVDFGVDEGSSLPFLVMPLLEGESLRARLDRLGPLTPTELLSIGRDLASGLAELHGRGVVHRDVKPSNLFLVAGGRSASRAGEAGAPELAVAHAELLDFGLAKVVAAQGSRANTTRNHGTPTYMAPEQLRGEGNIDARADLYSVGHLVFHALVGQPYWQPELRRAPNLLRFVRAVSGPLPERASERAALLGASLPARFDGWFAQATAPNRADRHEGAGEQAAALAEALALPAG
jgi:serine/threonine-protein kinase